MDKISNIKTRVQNSMRESESLVLSEKGQLILEIKTLGIIDSDIVKLKRLKQSSSLLTESEYQEVQELLGELKTRLTAITEMLDPSLKLTSALRAKAIVISEIDYCNCLMSESSKVSEEINNLNSKIKHDLSCIKLSNVSLDNIEEGISIRKKSLGAIGITQSGRFTITSAEVLPAPLSNGVTGNLMKPNQSISPSFSFSGNIRGSSSGSISDVEKRGRFTITTFKSSDDDNDINHSEECKTSHE